MKNTEFIKNLCAELNPKLIHVCYSDLNGVEWVNPMNRTNHNIFYYICSGEGQVHVNGIDYFPKKGDLVLLPADQYHFTKTVNKNHYEKYWCNFTAPVGNSNLFTLISTPICLPIENEDKIKFLFEKMLQAYNQNSVTSGINCKVYLLQIIAHYLENCSETNISFGDKRFLLEISQTLSYIEANISKHITIAELASQLHVHPAYFINLFKASTGMTPLKYINNLKLEKIKDALIFSNKSISEIADEFGMTPKYLSSLFKSHYCVSPSSMRKVIQPYQ